MSVLSENPTPGLDFAISLWMAIRERRVSQFLRTLQPISKFYSHKGTFIALTPNTFGDAWDWAISKHPIDNNWQIITRLSNLLPEYLVFHRYSSGQVFNDPACEFFQLDDVIFEYFSTRLIKYRSAVSFAKLITL